MFDTYDLNKPGALWQTLRLSSASFDGLTFSFWFFVKTNSISGLAWQTLVYQSLLV